MGALEEVARFLKRCKPARSYLPNSYLPEPSDPEGMANYLIFMVSIDHRTGPHFADFVDGEELCGAELLWKLGELKWREDEGFFSPRRMAKVGYEEVRRWLTAPRGVAVRGPGLRWLLLRDAARWLIRLYGGRGLRLVEDAQGSSSRIVELLRPLRAFSDPVAKKAYLLAKLLIKSGLMKEGGVEELLLPIDNHVTRVTLRLGLVRPLSSTEFQSRLELDVRLRLLVREVWRAVVKRAHVDPIAMDDLLWTVGREVCRRSEALCSATRGAKTERLREVAPWAWGACPFEDVCQGPRLSQRRRLREPSVETFWY